MTTTDHLAAGESEYLVTDVRVRHAELLADDTHHRVNESKQSAPIMPGFRGFRHNERSKPVRPRGLPSALVKLGRMASFKQRLHHLGDFDIAILYFDE